MSNPDDLINGTQVLSQSIYESILRKRRSAKAGNDEEQVESQRTFEEGDTGHVDIMSSFVTPQGQPDDLEDSQSIISSPAPAIHQLTQFSESQRFKATPATAGKKRTYLREIIETPLPQNPLLRQDQPSLGPGLGLSQVFAATQAASSPLSNGLPTGPRSDRPSPNIELQTRPATVSSSPLRPISEFKRTATDPAARYVSTKQSQAERERQQRLELLQSINGGSTSDDEFDRESSLVARKRRRQERDLQAKEEFRSLSSPILPTNNLPFSSPLRPSLQNLNTEESTETIPPLPDAVVIDGDDFATAEQIVSEDEDEHVQVDMEQLSQTSQDMVEEEGTKPDDLILVPKTGARFSTGPRSLPSEVDASPSIRCSHRPLPDSVMDLQSSEPFRIMDSQPSQGRARTTKPSENPMQLTSDVVDIVEQSSQITRQQNLPQLNEHLASSNAKDSVSGPQKFAEQQTMCKVHENDSSITPTVIPTNDDKPASVSGVEVEVEALETESALSHHTGTDKHDTDRTSTTYGTAPTHALFDSENVTSQMSSPIRATPPGRKRRRLLEISAEPSPRKPQSQTSFNAHAVLELDGDHDAADLLESSPQRSLYSARVADLVVSELQDQPELSSQLSKEASSQDSGPSRRLSIYGRPEGDHITPELSQDIVRPGRKGRLQRPSKARKETSSLPQSPIITRSSIFDIQVSPIRKVVVQPSTRTKESSKNEDEPQRARKKIQRKSCIEKRLDSKPTPNQAAEHKVLHEGKLSTPEVLPCPDIANDEVTAPEMVFAYYKGDPRGYYPARVLSSTTSGGYRIQWDGYEPEDIDAYGVKALDLRIGDTVKVLAEGFGKVPYIIQTFKDKCSGETDLITDIRGYQTLSLLPKRRKTKLLDESEALERSINIASIYLDTNMWAQLKLRNSVLKPVTPSFSNSGLATPIERIATSETPSSRNRRQLFAALPPAPSMRTGIFHNMAFAVSYDDSNRKNSLARIIHENGGLPLLDSFHDLLEPDTFVLKSQYSNVGFTALLTDRHSRKEKYMQALALGLPCLSGKWIEACEKHCSLVDWQSYLLPAGECAELDNFTRSRVLPPICADRAMLRDLVSSRPQLLLGTQIIVVVGRGKSEAKRAPYLFLLQAAGAENILTLPDVKSAKDIIDTDDSQEHKWIFVDDKDVNTLQELLKSGVDDGPKKASGKPSKHDAVPFNTSRTQYTVAGNELIVQSLILGKLYEA